MKLKRLSKITLQGFEFKVLWDKTHYGGSFDFWGRKITVGVKSKQDDLIFAILCHELLELTYELLSVRLARPDCDSDYMFVFDHRQFDTASDMFAGVLAKFIPEAP